MNLLETLKAQHSAWIKTPVKVTKTYFVEIKDKDRTLPNIRVPKWETKTYTRTPRNFKHMTVADKLITEAKIQ